MTVDELVAWLDNCPKHIEVMTYNMTYSRYGGIEKLEYAHDTVYIVISEDKE